VKRCHTRVSGGKIAGTPLFGLAMRRLSNRLSTRTELAFRRTSPSEADWRKLKAARRTTEVWLGSWSRENAGMGCSIAWWHLSARAKAAHALMAAISGLMPMMFITRVRL
jgi:hypothetical protein